MPMPEEEFFKRLRATFAVEADEHLQAIASGLLELEKSPQPARRQVVIEAVYREVHSLKGAARAVDLSDVEAVCQALESVMVRWKQQSINPSAETFDTLHRAVDAIRTAVTGSHPAGGIVARQRSEVIQKLNRLQAIAEIPGNGDSEVSDADRQDPSSTPPATTDSVVAPEQSVHVGETVRVSTSTLDAHLRQTEEMVAVKLMAAEHALELRDITALVGSWRKASAKLAGAARQGSRHMRHPWTTHPNGHDRPMGMATEVLEFLEWNNHHVLSLEERLTALAKQADQERQSVGRMVDNLLEDSKRLLMQPFSSLANQFAKVVRDLGRDVEKEVDLVLRGGEIEIDKRVLEEMKDVFIHILRNCIDHGVEPPDQRIRLNKPRRGTINITASQRNGNHVEIVVSDDGAGVDIEKLKKAAIQRSIIREADAHTLREPEVLALMYHSEVSTSRTVSAISGRGLGMAIVRTKVESLGGTMTIESQPGAGTSLRMILPLTMARFRGVLVRVADEVFVVPTASVERVLRVNRSEVRTVENRETITFEGHALSLVRLDVTLELQAHAPEPGDARPLSVIVLRATEQRIGFVVDEILYEEEVLVKPLKPPLVRIRNIAGATVLGSGKAVPILNVVDLIKTARRVASSVLVPAPPNLHSKKKKRKILVVEDSITSRMLLKNILESAGYQVRTAVDGVDAYTVLREEDFELVVSDVEMPRMNGYDLTLQIRADKRLAELPVVLVTALGSRDERERGIDAGANAYIVKSNFEQSDLLETVRRLV